MHRARKRFGQHFLRDQSVITQLMTAIAPKSLDEIVEIGPGEGVLTWPLLSFLAHLTVIEIDNDLAKTLRSDKRGEARLTVVNQDVLAFDFDMIKAPFRVVGNLPYNISTPLFFHLIPYFPKVLDLHCMVQEEVALRLSALPNTAAYGRLTVMMGYHAEVQYLFSVPASAFSPPPKVKSAVIRIVPYKMPRFPRVSEAVFSALVLHAFHMPRKTIYNNLKNYLPKKLLERVEIDSNLRPGTISIENYAKLSNLLCLDESGFLKPIV